MKKIEVFIVTEKGCDPKEGEYTILLKSFSEPIDIEQPGGNDDVSLVIDCIANEIDQIRLPEEGTTTLVLHESGEREDVFWNKYYTLVEVEGVAYP